MISSFEKGEEADEVDHFDCLVVPSISVPVLRSSLSLQYVLLDLVCMRAAIDKDLLYAGVREELEGVFDQWGVCDWQETLRAN